MTIKKFALSTQQLIEAAAATTVKRSHVYELMAAACGYHTYAALCSEAVFDRRGSAPARDEYDRHAVATRCRDLGYGTAAEKITTPFLDALATERLGVVKIADLISRLCSTVDDANLRWRADAEYAESDSRAEDTFEDDTDPGTDEPSDVIIESLESAAGRSNTDAHYALALLYRSDNGDGEAQERGGSYWYQERLAGAELSPVATEWADEFEREPERAQKAEWHLREAARLGQVDAQLDLAELFEDPMFFERQLESAEVDDPARVAEIAGQLGRARDERHWLTIAAESGDIESMRTLIETYDKDDLGQCWTWLHFAKLLGTDLARSNYRAYHDGGPHSVQEYDDDLGGPAYVLGDDGIELEPLAPVDDAIAKERANEMYRNLSQ